MTDRPATAAELADLTGAPLHEIADHLEVLDRGGAVERTGLGEPDPRYRPLVRPMLEDDVWAELPVSVRRGIFGSLLRQIHAHTDAAVAMGGFDRPDAHVSWTTMTVDETAYQRVAALLAETLDRAQAIQAEAADRRASEPAAEGLLDTEIVLLHFLRAPGRATAEVGRSEAGSRTAGLPSLNDLYALLEEICDEAPGPAPDWARLARRAREFASLAERRAPPLPRPHA